MASGLLTKSSIDARRRMAEELLGSVANGGPAYGGWGEGLARVAEGVGAGLMMRNANNQEEARYKSIADALNSDMTPDEKRNFGIVNEMPELVDSADRSEDRKWRQDRAAVDDSHWNKSFSADEANRNREYGLDREKFDWQKNAPPDPTADMREYEYSQSNPGFADYQQSLKKAGATSINNTVGGDGGYLDKKLDEKEAGTWGGYLDAADVSGGVMQDMQALDELLKVAPQGPLTGRAAEMFPGFSSAGDAVIATTKRIAPTLRTPGSGSTSDVEYEGMLQSVPRLSASPGGNQIISAMMKAKAQVNIERGQIISSYRNGEIDARTARTRIQELNKRSIMTPEMKAVIGQATGGGAPDNKQGTAGQGYRIIGVE